MSTVNYNTSFRTTGGLQRFDCLAWVNFNGTGTVAIRASGNVSSITDNGTGDYTVNFATAMPDANYAVTGSASQTATDAVTAGTTVRDLLVNTYAAGSFRVGFPGAAGTPADPVIISLSVFR